MGAYSYHEIYNKINPDAISVVPNQNTLVDIAQSAYAFEDVTITSSDSQIQARLSKDFNNFKNNVTSDFALLGAYKDGWMAGIEQELSSAITQGKITKSEAKRLYEEAKKQVEEKNKQDNTDSKIPVIISNDDNQPVVNTPVDNTPVVSETPTQNDIDPNLSTDIPSSDDGLEDIYDENFDSEDTKKNGTQDVVAQNEVSTVNPVTSNDDEYYSYVADLTLQALDKLYEQNQKEESSVLTKK